jgi:hypothetical protein
MLYFVLGFAIGLVVVAIATAKRDLYLAKHWRRLYDKELVAHAASKEQLETQNAESESEEWPSLITERK